MINLFIDIYGQSENYYQAEVSPDGDLILENFGPINVSGLTVENSKKRLISRLKKFILELMKIKLLLIFLLEYLELLELILLVKLIFLVHIILVHLILFIMLYMLQVELLKMLL